MRDLERRLSGLRHLFRRNKESTPASSPQRFEVITPIRTYWCPKHKFIKASDTHQSWKPGAQQGNLYCNMCDSIVSVVVQQPPAQK